MATVAIDYLIVGAGGGGGYASTDGDGDGAGGGGGGGAVKQGSQNLGTDTFPVVVGPTTAVYTTGANSSFNGITAIGGGRGGRPNENGGDGASGGGAGRGYYEGDIGTAAHYGGNGIDGYQGGRDFWDGDNYGGGGGGGATEVGGDAIDNQAPEYRAGGHGGEGVTSSISGTSRVYGSGGGGGASNGPGTGGTNAGSGTAAAKNAPANYGGGGGGGGAAAGGDAGGTGGSGVVILRYLTGKAQATGGTMTTSGAYTIHTFTSNGNFVLTNVTTGAGMFLVF